MATHDYVIANGSGAAVRADLNDALSAIVTQNSNATAPATTYAYQTWFDTSTSPATIKQRDASNVSWITRGFADGTIASSRVLVGGTSSRDTGVSIARQIQTEDTTANAGISIIRNTNDNGGSALILAKSRGTTLGSNTIVQTNDLLGLIGWNGADGTAASNGAASIRCDVDATPSAGIIPGRIRFLTTDTSGNGTERMRIESDGNVHFGKTGPDNTVAGISILNTTGTVPALVVVNTEASDTSSPFVVNRQGSDGRLAQFRQANTTEGTIAVSGTTVTYGGGHLARWSQLPNDEDPSSILKGTVMSNLDDMCEWGDEDNEQLNKTKISDIEGDPNVAGVFVSTSFDEEGPSDFFVAMTGDMVIRIAEGVTVERGDLLMSAGDGTAKPQDDDIIRSKTIAKVTSTHVSCTYEDGSYCVPCVLMAC